MTSIHPLSSPGESSSRFLFFPFYFIHDQKTPWFQQLLKFSFRLVYEVIITHSCLHSFLFMSVLTRVKYLKVTLNSEEEGAGGSMTESAMQNSIRLQRELDLITSSIQDASSLAWNCLWHFPNSALREKPRKLNEQNEMS